MSHRGNRGLRSMVGLGLVCVMTARGLGAVYTWSTEGGTWDGVRANWLPGPVVWPNTYPNNDTAFFTGGVLTVRIPDAWTNEVNIICLGVAGYLFAGEGPNSVLRFSGPRPAVSGSVVNAGCTFSNMVLDVGTNGVTFAQNGASTPFRITNQAVFRGTAAVNLRQQPSFGCELYIAQSQAGFPGGFTAWNNTRRTCDLLALVPDAFGSGPVWGSGQLTIRYPWGAQTTGGAPDGGKQGVTVYNGAIIALVGGTGSSAGDRFIVDWLGGIRGDSSRLNAVTHTNRFTPGGGTGAQAIFARGAGVMHTTVSPSSISSSVTNAPLLFGLGTDFNAAGFSLTIGAGTPWGGLCKDTGNDHNYRLQRGTITVHDGGGSFTQMVLRASGIPYGTGRNYFALGNTSDCPAFVASGGKVACRVLSTWQNAYDAGEVWLDSTAPNFSGAIHRWIVGSDELGGRLISRRANGFHDIPLALDHMGWAQQFNGTSTVASLAYRGASILEINNSGTDTSIRAGSLEPHERGSLLLVYPYGGNARFGMGTSPWERLLVEGYPTGRVTNHAVFVATNGPSGSLSRPELLDYDATVGFKVAAYDETANINNATNGAFVKVTTAQTVTVDRSMFGLVLGSAISCAGGGTDTYTLRLGRKVDGSSALFAPLLCTEGAAQSCRAKLDFGDAEGIVFFRYGGIWSHDLELYGSLVGGAGLVIWGSDDAQRYVHIRGAANDLKGPVTILQGYVSLVAGNGFAPTNDVEVKRGARLDTAISDTWGSLSGGGTVQVASGQTLTIQNRIQPGTSRMSLTVLGPGTLALAPGCEAVFDLEATPARTNIPALDMSTASLAIGTGATVKVNTLINDGYLSGTFDESFVLIRHNGTISGSFADLTLPPGTPLKGELVYTATEVRLRLTPRPAARGSLFLIL